MALAIRSWHQHWRRLGRQMGLIPVRYEVQCGTEMPKGPKIAYVLERDRLLDRLVLEDLSIKQGWPPPSVPIVADRSSSALWTIRKFEGWWFRRLVPADERFIHELIEWLGRHPEDDVVVVPVAVFLGRAPGREHSWIKLLLAEDWAIAGRMRRLFAVFAHGRDVLVKVSEPVSIRQLLAEDLGVERTTRKLSRLLRVHFQRQRSATIGPDLSHRRLVLDHVLDSSEVREAVRREVLAGRRSEKRVWRRARSYAREIAAHYSYPIVRLADRVLTRLWNRLYDGVDVRHLERLDDIASDSEVVYVPCHRSHIDYLLLSYVIYRRGLAPPHVAAGVNLNLPLVGALLRGGGAFFIRRSFQGNLVYSAVFRSYFRTILAKGFPVKYFVEGTRSRTGRLLNPKLGLLAMTFRCFLLDRRRPVVFVPVYFGYEKLIEGETFTGELRGQSKQQESLRGIFRSLGALREHFGTVYVSFGEPIRLTPLLDAIHPGWEEESPAEHFRPKWMTDVVDQLGAEIMTAINEAAVINPVNLTALILLSMPKQAIAEVELVAQLQLYLQLVKLAPYSESSGISQLSATETVRHCEKMKWLARRPHALGDVLYMEERRAVLSSYYRNNILHMFALPSLIASSFNHRPELTPDQLRALIAELYPCLKSELFLSWGHAELAREVDRQVAAMTELGLLKSQPGRISRPMEGTTRAAQFRLCAQIVQPFLERYYLGVALLLEEGSGTIGAEELVRRCCEAAEQLAMIYSLDAPDLFEAALFDNLVGVLLERGALEERDDGALWFHDAVEELARALGFVLSPQVKQTLLHLARAAATARPDAAALDGAVSEERLALRR